MPHSGMAWLRKTSSADLRKLPRNPLSLGSVVNRIVLPSLNLCEACGSAFIHRLAQPWRGVSCQMRRGKIRIAQYAMARLESDSAVVEAVVVTLTLRDDDVGLSVILLGTEQVAPAGAPEQLRGAVPPNARSPVPPITRLYVAVPPDGTVAEVEPPEAGASPSPATPLSDTDCGLPAALSVKTKLALCEPLTVGVKVTDTAQFAPAAKKVPAVLVCWNDAAPEPVIAIPEIFSVADPAFCTATIWPAS